MSRSMTEGDWKVFKRVSDAALERCCERVLKEVAYVASEPRKSAHERYGEVYRVMRERDEELAGAFNDRRHSNALLQLGVIRRLGLITDEELSQFSPETRAWLEQLMSLG